MSVALPLPGVSRQLNVDWFRSLSFTERFSFELGDRGILCLGFANQI